MEGKTAREAAAVTQASQFETTTGLKRVEIQAGILKTKIANAKTPEEVAKLKAEISALEALTGKRSAEVVDLEATSDARIAKLEADTEKSKRLSNADGKWFRVPDVTSPTGFKIDFFTVAQDPPPGSKELIKRTQELTAGQEQDLEKTVATWKGFIETDPDDPAISGMIDYVNRNDVETDTWYFHDPTGSFFGGAAGQIIKLPKTSDETQVTNRDVIRAMNKGATEEEVLRLLGVIK
ncbi:MAG: hypothetical protein KAS32_22275 [Candidatus Peribacteraceae bacterium]|nr:hypothetical protein [Candidatus Peribacteraceae bacterium]